MRTPALLSAPPPPPPKPQLPLGAARRGCPRPGTPGEPHALLRVRVAPAEGPGQGRGTHSSCPAARSCARRPDTWLLRDMSGRWGAVPRPLGLYLRCWASLPDPLGTERCVLEATGSELAGRAARNPERAAGHPGTCSPGRRMGPRTRMHTCAPRPDSARSRRPGSRRTRGSGFSEGHEAAWRPLGARRQLPGLRSRPPRGAALARLCPASRAFGAPYRTRSAGRGVTPQPHPAPGPQELRSLPAGGSRGGDKQRERSGTSGSATFPEQLSPGGGRGRDWKQECKPWNLKAENFSSKRRSLVEEFA